MTPHDIGLKHYDIIRLRTWQNNIDKLPDIIKNIKNIITFHKQIGHYIEENYMNKGTKRNHFATLGKTLRSLDRKDIAQIYLNKMKHLDTQINNNPRQTQKMSKREEDSWLSHTELLKLRDELEKLWDIDQTNLHMHYGSLIISWYTLRPPTRLEPGALEIIYSHDQIKTGYNYLLKIDDDKYEFILQKDKVSKTSGPLIDIVKGKLASIITKSLKIFPRTYLLTKFKDTTQPMGHNGLSKFITRIRNLKITLSMLRSSYITWIYNMPMVDLQTKRKLCDLMRLTTRTAELHYYKIKTPQNIQLYFDY